MRDLETIQSALLIAETGHLTFATLHTNSCAETINRIIDVFPTNQQQQIRTQLSFVLEGVLTQQLMPRLGGKGRIMAMEVMIPNPAIRNVIRENKIQQIYSLMQVGQAKFGMQTMNQALLHWSNVTSSPWKTPWIEVTTLMSSGRCWPPPRYSRSEERSARAPSIASKGNEGCQPINGRKDAEGIV